MKNSSITIIITAYHTENYIEECLDSIANQTWFKNNEEWEILVGIDHCEKTLEKVKSIMGKYKNIRVFYMTENVGTYITSNTLISKARYDRILRFDSDDIMKDYMVERMMDAMHTVNKCKLVQCYYENFPKQEGKRGIDKAHGVFLCRKQVFTKYGAFMPWKCGADTEFHTRIDKNYIYPIVFPQILFMRRIHNESLTRRKETDKNSELRKQYRDYIINESPENPIIKTVTAPAIEIFADANIIEEKLQPAISPINEIVQKIPVEIPANTPEIIKEKPVENQQQIKTETIVEKPVENQQQTKIQFIKETPIKYVKRISPRVTKRVCTGKYTGI